MNNFNIDYENIDIFSFVDLINTKDKAFYFCIQYGLIDKQKKCICRSEMRVCKKKDETHGVRFVCNRSTCKKTCSILKNSWFSKSNLSIGKSLLAIAAYANELENNQFPFYTGIKSSSTIVNWKSYFRDLCMHWVENREQIKIGGLGCTIEIDESMIFKRKNRVGRLLASESNHNWLFGGYCRETRDVFIVSVQDRTSETLLQALIDNVNPGTRIISDSWRAYRNISQNGFSHSMVNHSLNFVDSTDPSINTQTIERMWRTVKTVIPKTASSNIRSSYYCEFLFKHYNHWWSINTGKRIELIFNTLKSTSFN